MISPDAFLLFSIFQIKHYLGDFVFQSKYMLKKSAADWSFIRPLALHSFVHGVLTGLIACVFVPNLWWLGALDVAIHAAVDRLKSSPRFFGRFDSPTSEAYWRVFGLDQMAHHFTHIGIVWIICFS